MGGRLSYCSPPLRTTFTSRTLAKNNERRVMTISDSVNITVGIWFDNHLVCLWL
jgi:hypothetical protein